MCVKNVHFCWPNEKSKHKLNQKESKNKAKIKQTTPIKFEQNSCSRKCEIGLHDKETLEVLLEWGDPSHGTFARLNAWLLILICIEAV